MTEDEMKTLLRAFDEAMKAEGIGQGVRGRVIRRMLYGAPELDFRLETVPAATDGPSLRSFLAAARREMPVRQNSMLRQV
jgi:hypothetical protein